jgi:hypothetical protein
LKDPTLSTGARLLCVMLVEYQGKSVWRLTSGQTGPKEATRQTGAMRNPLRIGPGTTRNALLLSGPANPGEDGAIRDGMPPGDTQDTAAGWPAIPNEQGAAVPGDMPPNDTQSFAHRSVDENGAEEAHLADSGNGNILRIGLGARRKTLLPRDMEFFVKTVPGYRPACHLAMRNPPRIGPRAIRTTLLLPGLPFLEIAARCRSGQPAIEVRSPCMRSPNDSASSRRSRLARMLDQSAFQPLGPGDCVRHFSTQPCKNCSARVNPAHMIIRLGSGFFCEKCCPACHPAG